jgi:hypothetical protein
LDDGDALESGLAGRTTVVDKGGGIGIAKIRSKVDRERTLVGVSIRYRCVFFAPAVMLQATSIKVLEFLGCPFLKQRFNNVFPTECTGFKLA